MISVCAWLVAGTLIASGWQEHAVQRTSANSESVQFPAQFQVVTEAWNRVVAVPYIVYMPEKDRLLMLVSCDYPHQAMALSSDDHGATWTSPRFVHRDAGEKPDTGMGVALTYLGAGKAALVAGQRWFSSDYGETWGNPLVIPLGPEGQIWNQWDPMWVDRDSATGAVVRLFETGYTMNQEHYASGKGPGYSNACIRFSTDVGQTWDLEDRWILHQWSGRFKGANSWWPSSQATSSVPLPDGQILTAFGSGYRCQPNAQNMSEPRDVGLILWRPQ